MEMRPKSTSRQETRTQRIRLLSITHWTSCLLAIVIWFSFLRYLYATWKDVFEMGISLKALENMVGPDGFEPSTP